MGVVEALEQSMAKGTTQAKVTLYEVVQPLLNAMYDEFKELSKKKPDGVLSEAKIDVVNRLLQSCREILANEPSLQFLDLIDKDAVPQYSDVVLLLSQYSAAMKAFHTTYYRWNGFEHAWVISEAPPRSKK